MNKQFLAGDKVEVIPRLNDIFCHEFIGFVVGNHGDYITVRDQDDNHWDCVPEQIEMFNS